MQNLAYVPFPAPSSFLWPWLISSEFISQFAVPNNFVHYIASPNFTFTFYIPLCYHHYIYYLILTVCFTVCPVSLSQFWFLWGNVSRTDWGVVCLSATCLGRGVYFLRPLYIRMYLLVAISFVDPNGNLYGNSFCVTTFLKLLPFCSIVFYPSCSGGES